MTRPPPHPAKYATAAAFGAVAAILLMVESWKGFNASARGSLIAYLPEGIASAIVFVGLCWATRPIIGQPLFGRPKAVQIGPAPSEMRRTRRAF